LGKFFARQSLSRKLMLFSKTTFLLNPAQSHSTEFILPRLEIVLN
jgi:hypothetical protein